MSKKLLPKFQTGYVAFASVLVISAIILSIGITVTLTAVNELQSSLAAKKSEEALDFVEGCAEDALLRLNENGAIPVSITLPEGNCSVTIDTQVGNNWIFTVTGTLQGYVKDIQIEAIRDTNVQIVSWQEV